MTATASMGSVHLESRGTTRIITLNRPHVLNALDVETQERLLFCLRTVEADTDARALVLTGAGRAFSSGGDRTLIRAIAKGTFTDLDGLARTSVGTIKCLLTLPVPVIAAVRGPAVGMAAGLVALCDYVVMGEQGYLCDPNVAFGAGPHLECRLVWPLLTSYAVAKELLMTGRKVHAHEALQLGLVSRTCPDGEEVTTALEMVEEFMALPPAGLAAVRRAFNEPLLAQILRLIEEARETRELPNQAWLDKLDT
jgi:enoyl-CoA hydratase